MKALLKLSALVTMLVLIVMGCQKIMSSEDDIAAPPSKEFNAAFIKEWYYGSFKKTPEWQVASAQGKQLPGWKNGVVTKIGKWDAIEFPLNRSKSSFAIAGDKFTAAQCKKIADASISKIAFIKTDDNKIIVRAIDYIPDWEYLQNKQFDIGDAKTVNIKNDFTGMKIIKDWAGNFISSKILIDGKTVKTGRKQNPATRPKGVGTPTSLDDCITIQLCIWLQDCIVTIENDVVTAEECGEWYNSGNCWPMEECNDSDDGEDPCEAYGCGGDGGGGGGEEEEETVSCSILTNALQNAEFIENGNTSDLGSVLSETATEIQRSDFFLLSTFKIPLWASWQFYANNRIIITKNPAVKEFKDYIFGETTVVGTGGWYTCTANTLGSSSRTISQNKKTINGYHWYHCKVSLLFDSCPYANDYDRASSFIRKIEDY
jgi:hypothetical protein